MLIFLIVVIALLLVLLAGQAWLLNKITKRNQSLVAAIHIRDNQIAFNNSISAEQDRVVERLAEEYNRKKQELADAHSNIEMLIREIA